MRLSRKTSKGVDTMETKETPILISATKAQELFGFSRPMVYNLLNRNDCGVVTIGRRKFFMKDKLMAWLEKQSSSTERA